MTKIKFYSIIMIKKGADNSMDKEKFLRSIPLEVLEERFEDDLFLASMKKCDTWRELQELKNRKLEDYKNELIKKAYELMIDDFMNSHDIIDLYSCNVSRVGTDEYELNFENKYITIKYDLINSIPPEQMAKYLFIADNTEYGISLIAVIRCLLLYNSEDSVREGIKVDIR